MVSCHRKAWETEASVPESGRSLPFISTATPYSFNLIHVKWTISCLSSLFWISILLFQQAFTDTAYSLNTFTNNGDFAGTKPTTLMSLNMANKSVGLHILVGVDQIRTKMKTVQSSGFNMKHFISFSLLQNKHCNRLFLWCLAQGFPF